MPLETSARQDQTLASADKAFIRALAGERVRPLPIWLMRQAGRYLPEYRALRQEAKSFLDFCYSPNLAVEATLQPIRRFGFDAAILFSDILVVPDALGQRVWFVEGEGPQLEALQDAGDLSRLSLDGLHDHLAPVYETLRRLRHELPGETALIGFAGAPWTLACYMIEGRGSKDFATVKRWAYGDPDSFQVLIDLLVQAVSDYLIAQVEAGAEALQIFDSWASALSADAQGRWSLQPLKAIVARVKAVHPDVPVILFPRGVGLGYRAFAEESGADALSLDPTVPLDWARDTLQPHATLQGNLDPIALLAGGAALDQNVDAILQSLSDGAFVFNLGHGVVPPTDPEQVARLVERVRAWPA